MKLYAQHGHGDGKKTLLGMEEGTIQGVIYAPKYIRQDLALEKMSEIRSEHPEADILLDPQFYVNLHANEPNVKLGKLPDWDFFKGYRRSQLENSDRIDEVLKAYFEAQHSLPVSAILAPNIYISRSFDSIEASISKNFLRRTRTIYEQYVETRPLYASIVISREALLQQSEFDMFLNDLTAMDNPPDGFYVVIGARSSVARSDIFHADVIAQWMLINHALSVNGFEVINGYSDMLTPFLGMAGGNAGATGWWSNLRVFSTNSFLPERTGGGRLPIVRYLSRLLLNRIMHTERDAFSMFVPEVINNLARDKDYSPDRSDEVLQSWEALRQIIDDLVLDDVGQAIEKANDALGCASDAYSTLKQQVDIDTKSNDDHIEAIEEGMKLFRLRAEI